MDPSLLFSGHPTASWAAVSGVLSVVGAFLIRYRKISASIERTRIRTTAEALAAETAERASFRATIMDEMSVVRTHIKECEIDRELLRNRLNTAEGQIHILRASNEIMEKWVAFFRDGNASRATAAARNAQTIDDT